MWDRPEISFTIINYVAEEARPALCMQLLSCVPIILIFLLFFEEYGTWEKQQKFSNSADLGRNWNLDCVPVQDVVVCIEC